MVRACVSASVRRLVEDLRLSVYITTATVRVLCVSFLFIHPGTTAILLLEMWLQRTHTQSMLAREECKLFSLSLRVYVCVYVFCAQGEYVSEYIHMCMYACVWSLYSDPPLREFILHLNEKRQVLIRDLDATHIFVHSEHLDYIRTELERFRKNTSFETVVDGE